MFGYLILPLSMLLLIGCHHKENNIKADDLNSIKKNFLKLEYEDLRTFVIDNKFLIVFFQPYTVGGLGDGPWQVKIPYEHLRNKWNTSHPLPLLLDKTVSSKSYTASWNQEDSTQIEVGDKL